MCGRYALFGPHSRWQKQFGFMEDLDFPEHFNIAPSMSAPVVRETQSGRVLELASWGLQPSWAREPDRLPRPINARAEDVASRPMFRHAFRHSRVLVPASGFYEWRRDGQRKTPHFIHPAGDGLFGLGGLFEHWRGPGGELSTFCILVMPANELLQPIHPRMPVIIAPADYAAWLDPALTDTDAAAALMRSYPAKEMRAHEVGREVNRPGTDHPGLAQPVGRKAK